MWRPSPAAGAAYVLLLVLPVVAAAAVADAALKRDRRARLALTMIVAGEGRVAARLEEFPY